MEPVEKLVGPEGVRRMYSRKEAWETRNLGEVEIRPCVTTCRLFRIER